MRYCLISRHLAGLWTSATAPTMELLRRILPLGLLVSLESEDSVPKDDIDRLNVRDNLKMAIEADKGESIGVLLAAGKGIRTAKVAAVKTAEIVTEKTYVYTEQARKIAKHIDLALTLTHWVPPG